MLVTLCLNFADGVRVGAREQAGAWVGGSDFAPVASLGDEASTDLSLLLSREEGRGGRLNFDEGETAFAWSGGILQARTSAGSEMDRGPRRFFVITHDSFSSPSVKPRGGNYYQQ